MRLFARFACFFLLSLSIATPLLAQHPGTLVTIAGGGLDEGENVPATDVALNTPQGIALDATGSLYIADTRNNRIRRVDPSGIITTIAGNGEAGFSGDGGPATQAQLNAPQGIALDGAGNIYIGDTGNRRVRRIDPSGIITTIAGTGERGFSGDNGPALEATFDGIVALLPGNGVLFVSDGIIQNPDGSVTGNFRVRQIDLTTGTINTIAGNGSPQASSTQDGGLATRAGMTPEQLAAGGGGIYIADVSNGRIRRIGVVDSATVITTVAGRSATVLEEVTGDLFKGDGGPAIQALLFTPTGVAVGADGTIYIADTSNNRIRAVDPESNIIVTIAGSGASGAGPEGELALLSAMAEPSRMLIDGNGDLIFIDTGNSRIRKFIDPQYRTPLFAQITTNLDFGRVSYGDPSIRSLQVENRGNQSVQVQTFASDNPAFQLVSELPLVIGPSQIAQIDIVFDPLAEGLVQGLITITTDDPRTPLATFTIQGTGEAPIIGIFPEDVLAFDPTFTTQSQTRNVRISNRGAGTLVVSGATTTDSQFVANLTNPLRINSGSTGQLPVAFQPKTEGPLEAVLTISSNAPGNPNLTLTLQGVGVFAKPGGFVNAAADVGLDDPGAGFGAAWADYDNDGDPDLYLTRSLEPNRLYQNTGGAFTEVAATWGVNDDGDGSAGIWGDYDNDGDLDLFVTNFGQPNRLYRNDGNRFSDVAPTLGADDPGDGYGAAWADYDRDGDLDLYVANFGANRFYRNDGDRFSERADSLGVSDTESGIQPAWADYDNDGDPDLFLANSGPNRLFRNDGDQFTSTENDLAPVDTGPSFGAAWGDYDNDGDLDLFIPYFGAENRLYINLGDGKFQENARFSGLLDEGRGRGAVWGDMDNDGFLDLYVTNSGQPNLFYRNVNQSGARAFVEQADSMRIALSTDSLEVDSRGVALVDYDSDGGLDLFVAVQNGADAFFTNREANGNWIAVRPLGTESTADAIGTRIEIAYKNGQSAIREITGGASFLSQDALFATFGVGDALQIDAVTVRWPSGIVQQLRSEVTNLSTNQTIIITEERPLPPVRIVLESSADRLLANGIAEADLTARVVNASNERVFISDRVIAFRVETGGGLIIGGDSIAVRDGLATARYRSGQTVGQTTLIAESVGLEPGRVTIDLLEPFGDDALSIRTVAGIGFSGFDGDGGPATEARLNAPVAVLADTLGNIYLTDTRNHRIRQIDIASGAIQTIVGTGVAGLANIGNGDPAIDVAINDPQGLAWGVQDNLIISETSSHVVRQVQNDTMRALAGTGTAQFGGDRGPAPEANLRRPIGIATGPDGALYIADEFNQRIRKVDASGTITTFAGSGSPDVGGFFGDGGPANQAQLNRPSAVAVDLQGRLYIADTNNHRVRMVDTNGIITTIAGTGTSGYFGDGGPATLARLDGPSGLVIDDSGHLFIADTNNHRIRLLDRNTGLIQTVAGTGLAQDDLDAGGALAVSLNNPQGLALTPTGTVLIADTNNHRVRELTVQFNLPSIFQPPEKSIDFNADDRLDFADFVLFASAFGDTDTTYDLDSDGQVGFADFVQFARAFEEGRLTVRP